MKRADIAVLFERYGPMVYRRARQILGHDGDAEEALQEVFIRALTRADTFASRSAVSTWLYRITTNYCLNLIRDRSRRRELWATHGPGPEAAVEATPTPSKMMMVRRLLAEADEAQAQAAVYVHVDGMSHQEAARVMGVSRRTVGNLLVRFGEWATDVLADPGEWPKEESD
jgi:RNA polymerase sigma-70 factor (ECF subfamily)